MKYYQVNQRESFDREFSEGYLCCPEGNRGGWTLMKELQIGDIMFHYNSAQGAVLGISRIVEIGHHKGTTTSDARVIEGTQCIRYQGPHLSQISFDDYRRQHLSEAYKSYYEVHTKPIFKKKLGKLLPRTPQVYLVSINERVATRFLNASGVEI